MAGGWRRVARNGSEAVPWRGGSGGRGTGARQVRLAPPAATLLCLVVVLAWPLTVAAQEAVDLGPGRWQVGDKEIVVSPAAQRLWAYEGETPVLTTLVSTGTAETPTPVGQWRISVKLPSETMAGAIDGVAYHVPDVPHVMYFTDLGHALHGTYWHNNFGTPMSHGCVNLPLDVAEWLYGWAPEGTCVTVVA